MDATFLKADEGGLVHYYCDHHAPESATHINGIIKAPESKIKKFLPLIIIFSSIILFTATSVFIRGSWSTIFAMRMMMGSFFLIFGAFKIFNIRAFAEAYSTYDILAMRSRIYAFIYPFLELLIAFLYLSDIGGIYRDIFTFILMVISSIGVIKKIRQKEEVPCACLGMVFKIPMTSVTLIEDILMALEALFMIMMPIGLYISQSNTNTILNETLKLHTGADWARESTAGHWVLGIFMIVILFSSIAERYVWKYRRLISKYLAPLVLVLFGSLLSLFAPIEHGFFKDEMDSVWYLLTHNSQFLQHFLGGFILIIISIAEYIRFGKEKSVLKYVAPVGVALTGIIFFFHQQLGVVPSVLYAMNWHMSFGAFMIIGAVFRILDILLFEERKSFFRIWIVALLIGASMMMTYHEPAGAYQLSTNICNASYCIKSDFKNKTYSANTPMEYSFSILNNKGSILKDFATTHTKVMHLIVVRKDLKYFQHLHPVLNSESGIFSLSDLSFPSDGEYRIFADFMPKNGQVITISEDVKVGKDYAVLNIGTEEKEKIFDGYKVAISSNENFVSNEEITLTFNLKQGNKIITDLEEYLGALGHSVILRENTLDFIHAHPMEDLGKIQNGNVDFMVNFPLPGKYKIFTQFKKGGKVFTTDFVVSVEQGMSMANPIQDMDHSMH